MKAKLFEVLATAAMGAVFAAMIVFGLDYQLQVEEAAALQAAAERQAEERAAK